MAKRILREHKRSSSCSENSEEDDIIYDIMSSGEDEGEDKPKKNVGSIIKKWPNKDKTYEPMEGSSPVLPPRMRPLKSDNKNNSPFRTFNLFSLSLDKTLQLPVIVEVIDGVCGKDAKNTFAQKEEVLICSKVMTNYVTCVKAEDTCNISISTQYEVTLVNLDTELNKKTKETVKGILGMVKLPNRIIANSQFQINGVKVTENQILEINEGRRDPNAKYLSVQTLSGEDIELSWNMKVTFSCSLSAHSIPLTIAIESCIFPQTVILIEKTNKFIKKELCTLIDCFSKKMFLACHYEGDVKTSLRGEETLVELPLDLPLTFRVIRKPEDSHLVFKKLELQSQKGFKITDNNLPQKKSSTVPVLLTKQMRSNSTSDLTNYVCKKMYEQRPLIAEKPSTPQPEKTKHFFSKSNRDYSIFERTKSPPLVKPKTNKTNSDKKEVKRDSYCTPENLLKLKNKPPIIQGLDKKAKPIESVSSPANSQLMEENKQFKEKIKRLENLLSEKDIINNELDYKVKLLEVALAEANAINIEHETSKTKSLLSKRILPPLPGGGRSAPTSPIRLIDFPNTQSPVTHNPIPLTTKPKLPTNKDPHYKSSKDNPREPPTQIESQYSDTVLNTTTTHYLASILEKVNFGQYKNIFLREGINTEILAELDEKILEDDLGIKTALHRRKLIKLAEKLKNKEDISSFYVDPQYTYGTGKNVLYEKIN